MRHDLIGPRRLRPAGTFNNPIFTMTGERSDRVLKGLVMPGVTEGAQNGVLPGVRVPRPPQPALIVKARDQIPGGLADKKTDADFDPKAVKMGQKVEMEHTNDPAKAREIARDHLVEDPNYYIKLAKMEGDTHKAIEGQQSVAAPISAHDPAYAQGHFTHQQGSHIDAAKHHIQADHFSRQKGGEMRAQYHQKEFNKLKAAGANPTREHYRQAMGELSPKFAQVMRSLDALGKAAAEKEAKVEGVYPKSHPGAKKDIFGFVAYAKPGESFSGGPQESPEKIRSKLGKYSPSRDVKKSEGMSAKPEMQREPSSVIKEPKVKRQARPTVEIPRETMQQVVSQKLKSLAKAAEKLAGPIPQH